MGTLEHVKEKELQLGMKQGTAAHRLRTMIMFDLAGRCGLLRCFKCGLLIESVQEFSIEHKEPWFGGSVDLFWDMKTSPSRIAAAIME